MNEGDSHVAKLVNSDWIQRMKCDLYENKYILRGVNNDENNDYLKFDNSSIYYKNPFSDILEIIVHEDNNEEKYSQIINLINHAIHSLTLIQLDLFNTHEYDFSINNEIDLSININISNLTPFITENIDKLLNLNNEKSVLINWAILYLVYFPIQNNPFTFFMYLPNNNETINVLKSIFYKYNNINSLIEKVFMNRLIDIVCNDVSKIINKKTRFDFILNKKYETMNDDIIFNFEDIYIYLRKHDKKVLFYIDSQLISFSKNLFEQLLCISYMTRIKSIPHVKVNINTCLSMDIITLCFHIVQTIMTNNKDIIDKIASYYKWAVISNTKSNPHIVEQCVSFIQYDDNIRNGVVYTNNIFQIQDNDEKIMRYPVTFINNEFELHTTPSRLKRIGIDKTQRNQIISTAHPFRYRNKIIDSLIVKYNSSMEIDDYVIPIKLLSFFILDEYYDDIDDKKITYFILKLNI